MDILGEFTTDDGGDCGGERGEDRGRGRLRRPQNSLRGQGMTSKLIERVEGPPGDFTEVPFCRGTLVLVAICPIFFPFSFFSDDGKG